ncbi:hypothetical protein ACHAPX_000956 [Trichoderma viride]
MFKKDLQGAPKQKLKSSAQRALRQNLLATYPLLTPYIEEILPKKASLASMKLPDRNTLYVLDSVPLFYQNDGSDLLPHLKLVHRFPQAFPSIRIDRGAIRFVLSGATLMAPGLTSAGGRLPVDGAKPLEEGKEMEQSIVEDGRWSRELAKGEPVVIMAEGKEEACAVGTLAAGTDEVKAKGKGPVVEDAHYLGDGLWNLSLADIWHNSVLVMRERRCEITTIAMDIRRRVKTLLLSTGENYQVTETTSSVVVKDQKLKSFHFKKNGNCYEVVHKSGQLEVLSNAGNSYNTTVPIELPSPTGRQLKLVWTHSGEQPRLQKIQDGSDVLLNIEYSDALVKITQTPGTAEANAYLTKVKGPAGLEEDIVYNKKGHQLPRGAPQNHIPYVSLHTQLPRNSQPAIKTKYGFSNQNFLEFGSGFDWKDGDNNLYRAREDYRYSSTVQVDGGATTKYTQNRFHLIVSSETSKGETKTTQTTTYHMLSGRFSGQPAQYQLPKSVQTAYQNTTNQAQRVETTQYAFDDWSNSTQFIQPTGVKIDREYYPPAGEADHCPSDPHGFQRYIKSTTVTPAPST